MSTEYVYTKVLNIDRLTSLIQSSSVITIALDYITDSGAASNNLSVWMKAALSTTEESELDDIVDNCSNEPLPYADPPVDENGVPITRPEPVFLDGKKPFTKKPYLPAQRALRQIVIINTQQRSV